MSYCLGYETKKAYEEATGYQHKVGTNAWYTQVYGPRYGDKFKVARFKGKLLPLYLCGRTPEGFEVWTPLCNERSHFAVILDPSKSRGRYVYDPGNHWRNTLADIPLGL